MLNNQINASAHGKVLLFRMNIFKESSIRDLCRDLGLEAVSVSEQDFGKTIGELAGMPAAADTHFKSAAAVPFHEEMMVFCALAPEVFDRFLAESRKRGLPPVALKAVLTPYNARWTPGRLCAELSKEHQALK